MVDGQLENSGLLVISEVTKNLLLVSKYQDLQGMEKRATCMLGILPPQEANCNDRGTIPMLGTGLLHLLRLGLLGSFCGGGVE
jgi:hypothetical protein